MRKILIVGAGTSGLQLAHGLLHHGYDVTVINGSSSQEIRTSLPSITQFALPTALAHEQTAGLAMWEHLAPRISGTTLHLYPPDSAPTTMESAFDTYGVSVDRRVRIADWLEFFEDQGGKAIIHGVTVSDLDYFTRMFELVILAVGHGELGQLFDQDTQEPSTRPRRVAQAIVEGVPHTPYAQWHIVDPPPDARPGAMFEPVVSDYAEVASAPQVRAILSPVLVDSGPHHVLQLVGSPGGHMETWPDRPGPQETWRLMRNLLDTHAPHLALRLEKASLLEDTDAGVHTYDPHVRTPVATLPSGGLVLGMADAVISTDDPIAAQANNVSSASANHYLSRILAHGSAEFDREWMTQTFTGLWNGSPTQEFPFAGMGQAAVGLSQVLDQIWSPTAPDHLGEVLDTATKQQRIADRFLGDLDDPRRYAQWLYDPESALDFLAKCASSTVLD